MRNPEVHNSKPASHELRSALVPGAVRVEILKFGDLANQRADQLTQQKQAKVSDGMVHAIPNTDNPRYHQMAAEGKFSGPAKLPTEPFLNDSFVVPPSTRVVETPRKSKRF